MVYELNHPEENICEILGNMANARLIAAAPELLTCLKLAVARIELANAEGNNIMSAWLPDAKAAITAAEGGEL